METQKTTRFAFMHTIEGTNYRFEFTARTEDEAKTMLHKHLTELLRVVSGEKA